MASFLLTLLHTFQAAFSAYNLYLASISISNLQQYEEKSEKAAKYSNIAENQLHNTRTTQASGTIAIILSFLSSGYLLLASKSKLWGTLVSVANVAALVVVRSHVGEFWKGKAKVPLPGTGDYNEAISKTQETRLNMGYLAVSWVAGGALALIV